MVPKFRAWDKGLESMIPVESIDFEYGMINVNAVWRTFEEIELMQSTGLKDKNGMEIFERDIVVNQYGNVGYVAYLQQEAGFVVVLKKSDYRLGHRNTGESYDVTTNHEVIGNIHSNPELLDKSNEN
ncbi:YopX family protein [Enterococcus casseliflavus]|uniref:YopX family protein n=1 Tax=Enterococcus casseliflavus TaxID=37734 RepID=UPI003D6AFFF2